jgi:hypothetical protein
VNSRFSNSWPADIKCSARKTFRVFEQLDDVVNDIVNFAAANDAPGLEGKYPFNELLHSFEVHYPIRFPCFSTIG